jgi:hypothetical protein
MRRPARGDEQRADRGEQDLAEPSGDADSVGRPVVAAERLRRIRREDASIDEGWQLSVEPRNSAAHLDIMRDPRCHSGNHSNLKTAIRN